MPANYPIPYSEAVRTAARNRAGVWHRAGAAVDDTNGDFAFQRLWNGAFEPRFEPLFKIPRESKFFMMGSCFARGLEAALHSSGLTMLSKSDKFDAFETRDGSFTALGCTNRYNTGSIANEFKWALDPENPFPEEALVDFGDHLCSDPHMTPTLKPVDRVATLDRRRIFTEVSRSIAQADVIILTLGLTEVWRDIYTGLVTNTTPDGKVAAEDKDRFVFDVLRYDENLKNLEVVHRLLQKYGKLGHKMIVTVSPVPLGRTFTAQDVVVANTYSKATLRAAASDFVSRHDNVDYFPAYETVMNSDQQSSWIEDKRHPRGSIAQHVIRMFVQEYIQDVSASDVSLDVEYVA